MEIWNHIPGHKIRATRAELRMPLDTLAALAGTNAATVSRYERGMLQVSAGLQRRLQMVLHIARTLAYQSALPIDWAEVEQLRPIFEKFDATRLPEEVAVTERQMRDAGELASEG